MDPAQGLDRASALPKCLALRGPLHGAIRGLALVPLRSQYLSIMVITQLHLHCACR